MNNEETVTVEVRPFEDLFGVIEEEAVPVCPVIRVVAKQMADMYLCNFSSTKKVWANNMLILIDEMRMQGEYEFALAALETMFLIEGDPDVDDLFEILEACCEGNDSACAMFINAFFDDEDVNLLLWEVKLKDSIKEIS